MRKLLWGTFQNTAFVVFSPDGKQTLTKSGRSPRFAFGRNVAGGMTHLADKYQVKDKADQSELQDFHSFKQSLNVASADQRLLVYTVATNPNEASKAKANLTQAFNDKQISGRFHFDQFTPSKKVNDSDKNWNKVVKNRTLSKGTFIIKPGEFGQDGIIMQQLPLSATAKQLKAALLVQNGKYTSTEKRKVYSQHISKGKKLGINYKNTMPPGEDRDGDGKIDPKPRRRR